MEAVEPVKILVQRGRVTPVTVLLRRGLFRIAMLVLGLRFLLDHCRYHPNGVFARLALRFSWRLPFLLPGWLFDA
jgi:hypothetical protein